jgi:hypothetical protein
MVRALLVARMACCTYYLLVLRITCLLHALRGYILNFSFSVTGMHVLLVCCTYYLLVARFTCLHPQIFHSLSQVIHATDLVRRNGAFSNTCTGHFEKAHTLFAKRPAKHHNNKNAEIMMMKHIQVHCLMIMCYMLILSFRKLTGLVHLTLTESSKWWTLPRLGMDNLQFCPLQLVILVLYSEFKEQLRRTCILGVGLHICPKKLRMCS